MGDLALPIRSPPELALGGRLSSDERLARLVSGGSARAFALLYQRHHQALYRYCRSIVRDPDDAQDALQSAMMRAFAALAAGERDLAVRPWLFRIAHNEAISILRRRRPQDDLVDEQQPSGVTVERTVDQRERLRILVADLQALPERQRAALLMRELNGLSIQETAAALSVSPGAAKQTLFEARTSLHELAEGRVMECETVRGAISDGDGRVLRGRKIRAHLRSCVGCRDFRALIDTRSADLRALVPPLPAAAATAMLGRLLAHGAIGAGHGGGAAVASGAALGNHAAASLAVKALAGVAIVTVATAGTVHLASGSHRHKLASPPVRRNAPLPSRGATGKDAGPHSRIPSSTTQPPRGHLKVPGAGGAGRTATGEPTALPVQATTGGSPAPAGALRSGASPPQATGGGKASGRGRPAGKRLRRSSPAQGGSQKSSHTPNHPHQPQPGQGQARTDGKRGATPARGVPAEQAGSQANEHGAPAGTSHASAGKQEGTGGHTRP